MAGLDENTPVPTEITLHRGSRRLELAFDDAQVAPRGLVVGHCLLLRIK